MRLLISMRFSRHPTYLKALKIVLIITGVTAASAIVVPATIAALGFSTGGVVAGESPNICVVRIASLT